MTPLKDTIAKCRRINGEKGNYTGLDRALAIEMACELSGLKVEVEGLKDNNKEQRKTCDKAREDLWGAINNIQEKSGRTREKVAHTRGMVEGKHKRRKRLWLIIPCGIAGAALFADIILQAFFW